MCLPPCAKRILYHRLFRGPRPESAMNPQGNQTVRNQIQPYVLHFSEVLIPNNSRPQGVRTTAWWAGHCCPAHPHFGRVCFMLGSSKIPGDNSEKLTLVVFGLW
ncbi:hypothetical protein M404DRAFT_243045 [Pisolithus tinctorius Marx 270]|uniref:Uncharacterized protein n=1 Tax=Pisolithus tinctorius Marx 270 TaxID=870435 RepID=A0A0C3N6F1_PISTI|nr:hypothetical protein M404DRAFT_243045 [Pisolithus tinctorius Marx 270]